MAEILALPLRVASQALALLFAAATLQAAVQVSLPNASGAPGGSVAIPITCSSQGDSVSALQFDLSYESNIVSLTATVGDAARNAGKGVYFADVAPGQTRFLITGLNQDSLADGTVVNLFLNLNPGTRSGNYALTVFGVVAADPNAYPLATIGANAVLTVQGSSAARLSAIGVLNAASLLPGPVAPGEIVTLMGAGIGPMLPQRPGRPAAGIILNGVSVLFDATPSVILYAATDQIDLVVPYEVYGEPVTQLAVIHSDTTPGVAMSPAKTVATLSMPVATASPALFTVNATGVGPAAILNQDSTLNTPANPAVKGSMVTLLATGAGQTNPPGVDGPIAGNIVPKPLLAVSAQIGGVDALVLSAGISPALGAGVLQVVCVIPTTAPSGLTVPILVTVGQTNSQVGVTIAIR